MAALGGSGGDFVGWGPLLSVRDPTDKICSFSEMFWLIGTAFALHNLFTLTTLEGFTRGFRENRDLLVFRGVRALREIPGPNQQKNWLEKN